LLGALIWAAVVVSPLCQSTACAASTASGALKIIFFDADGGAATLFVTPDGHSLLIDGGYPAGLPVLAKGAAAQPPMAQRIIAKARALGLSRIDVLIVSHYHGDHLGGVLELIGKFPIGQFVDHGENSEWPAPGEIGTDIHPSRALSTSRGYSAYLSAIEGKPRMVAKPADKLRLGDLTVDVVASDRAVLPAPLPGAGEPTPGCAETPNKPVTGGEEDAHAIGIVATFGKARILFLTDITWDVEQQLVCPINRLGAVDLMIVSHHGVDSSNSPTLLSAARPRVAVINNGSEKGADEVVLYRLRAFMPAAGIWQIHSATRSPWADVDSSRIANLAGGVDAGYALEALVDHNGAVTVVNDRTRASVRYPRKNDGRALQVRSLNR